MLGLYGLKQWFATILDPVLNLAVRLRLSPDVFTLVGVFGGCLAGFGVCTLQSWLVLLGGLIRLAGANLDGGLARRRGKPTRGGFFKNELGDRAADFATMLGFFCIPAVSADALLFVSLVCAIVMAVAPSIASWFGVSRGLPRINGGPLGKTERVFLAVLAVAMLNFGAAPIPTLLGFAWLVTLGSIVTAVARLRRIHG